MRAQESAVNKSGDPPNVLGNGLALTLIRRAHARESAEAFAFWGNLVIAAGTALALPWLWRTPDLADLGLFLLAGICGGTAFLVLAQAFRLAPAAVVAPFQYSQMLHGLAIGWLCFAERPEPGMLLDLMFGMLQRAVTYVE